MKWSVYNELIELNDCYCLFNPLRGKHLILTVELNEILMEYANDIDFLSKLHPQLFKCLESEKFIVPDNEDEVADCIQMLECRFSSKSNLVITINPTLDCNLRCWYCYESHIKGSCMQPNVIERVIKYVEKQVQCEELNTLQLSFFGGEPLLKYQNVIKPIVENCSRLCLTNGKQFAFNITTNGVCLTPKVTDELLKFGVLFGIQVAFDGNKKLHDSVKCFQDGRGCYDLVHQHLSYAIEKGISTTVRCNYTKTNIDSFVELLTDFRKYWNNANLRFSFHKVWQELESEELSCRRKALKEKITHWGIRTNVDSYYGDSLTPCYADSTHNVVINYNGDIFKCTARDFKPEHRLGFLDELGTIIYCESEPKGIAKSLTRQCYTCKLLPICTICFQQRNESVDGNCPNPQMRENASENIKKYFCDIINKK